MAVGRLHRHVDQTHHRGVGGLIEAGHPFIESIDRQRVTGQVVRADAQEVAFTGQILGDQRRRGDFNHHPHRHGIAERNPFGAQLRLARGQDRLGRPEFFEGRDHGEEDPHLAVASRPEDGTQLAPEDVRAVEADSDGPPAEERIGFAVALKVARHLVAPQIQRADDGLLSRAGLSGHGAVGLELLLFGRGGGAVQEEELRAEQPDAIGPAGLDRGHVFGTLDVRREDDGVAVERDRGLFAQQGELLLEQRPALLELAVFEERLVGGVERQHAAVPVEQGVFAVVHRLEQGPQSHHRRNPHLAGHDGRVAGLAAGLGGESEHMLAVQQGRDTRCEIMGHQDAGLGEVLELVLVDRSGQVIQHPTGQIPQIGGPLPQVGVIDRSQHGHVFLEDIMEGRLGAGVLVADLAHDLTEQRGVFEYEQVRLEEAGLGGAHGRGDLVPDFLDVLPRSQQCLIQTLHLVFDGAGVDLIP